MWKLTVMLGFLKKIKVWDGLGYISMCTVLVAVLVGELILIEDVVVVVVVVMMVVTITLIAGGMTA